MAQLDLPFEVIQHVLASFSHSPASLASLRLVNRTFSRAALALLLDHARLTSSTQTTRFLSAISSSHPNSAPLCKSLTLARGSRTKTVARTSGKGKAKRTESVEEEDAIDEQQLVAVVEKLGRIEELVLRELAFVALRRRQLSFTGGLGGLRKLSIHGRPSIGGFNLATVGNIVSALPLLTSLALSHISVHPTSLTSLSPPTCLLTSFSLHATKGLSAKQLRWLLRPTSHAETLRHLALEWDGKAGKALNAVRYIMLRVNRLEIKTRTEGLVESLMLHAPSLEVLELRVGGGVRIDAARMVENVERPLKRIVDWSEDEGDGRRNGLDRRRLAWIIASDEYSYARELKEVRVVRRSQPTRGDEMLALACAAQGVRLVQIDSLERTME